MKILLTGGTGFIGSSILQQLLAAGHEVTALARSETSAEQLKQAGAETIIGDITDVAWLSDALQTVDGAIHTASPGDATSANVDTAVAMAVVKAFHDTTKPYVHTSGVWIYGAGEHITEQSPLQPPPITAWRTAVEQIILDDSSVQAMIVVPSIVYGHGAGLPNLIAQAPQTESGGLTMIGNGAQHWSTVHVDDLADLYIRALLTGTRGNYYIGSAGVHTVYELSQAASQALSITADPVSEAITESRIRLGELLADALSLDQHADSTKAHTELNWSPQHDSLIDELAAGGYAS